MHPWNTTHWQDWQARLAQGRVPHSVLLAGPQGLGKGEFARHCAKGMLCHASAEQCNCKSCLLFQAGNHPDFINVQPEEPGKAIKVDDIRTLSSKLVQTAQLQHYQVAIIEPAEAMNTAAANALLKTLEEPAGDVLIILVSHQPARLLPTIRSRCQQLTFNVPTADVALEWLKTHSTYSAEQLQQALNICEGVPLQALELLANDGLAARVQIYDGLFSMLQGKLLPTTFAEQLKEQASATVLQTILLLVVDVLRLREGVAITNTDYADAMARIKYDSQRLWRYIDYLQETLRTVQHHTGLNQQLVLEGALITLLMDVK